LLGVVAAGIVGWALPKRQAETIHREDSAVVDIGFVLITIVFFGLCVAYVRACDRIIGPDEPTRDAVPDTTRVARS
jgi:hypothetical protein